LKILVTSADKCAGCRACETICSLTKEKEIRQAASRIHIVRREWDGLYVQAVCQQCDPPICRSVCPAGAVSRDSTTGAMTIDSKCSLCGSCAEACPFGAIHLDARHDKMLVCDLCGGKPKCVEWCPHQAIEYLADLSLSERRLSQDRLIDLMKITDYRGKIKVRSPRR
jgi:carbon-monoxide dehydrogenase iron sulfur subunit